MSCQPQCASKSLNTSLRTMTRLFCAGVLATTTWMQAQTLTVLHTFTLGPDGGKPTAGLTPDAAGNLYGTTYSGGPLNEQCFDGGCGVVFKMTHGGSGWILTPLYSFGSLPDGQGPQSRVIFGPDGALYGTTYSGGAHECCGTVFKLQPPANSCGSFSCPWRETILYSFTSLADGAHPTAEVVFDRVGNLYGTTSEGGGGPCEVGCGTVFELSPNGNGTWSKSTLHSFQGGASDGASPDSALLFDSAGNLYGTTYLGGDYDCYSAPTCGTVFELTPSGSGWTEKVLHIFADGPDGGNPAGLVFDSEGNLYGAASSGPGEFGAGTIFELTPNQGGGWTFTVPYTFTDSGASFPNAPTMDAAGNIYGGSQNGGVYGPGAAYKLTRSNGGWSYATLGSFEFQGASGSLPEGTVVVDAQGNVYGACYVGPPPHNGGTVWEITP